MSHRPKVADPTELKWPVVDSDEEKAVLEALETVFSKYKSCLRTIKKPPKWKKKGEGDIQDRLTEEEEKQKKEFKSMFVVGVQTVMRNLEKDKLSVVLLWKDMQPAVLRNAFCHLLREHSCPAICLSDLLLPLQKSWPGLTSAAALGILKTDVPNAFHELNDIVSKQAPPLTNVQVRGDKAVGKKTTSNKSVNRKDGDSCKEIEGKQDKACEEEEKTLAQPVSDPTKYYIYKPEAKERKSFSGQNFIGLNEGADSIVQCKHIETVKGVRIQANSSFISSKNQINFGIRPSLVDYNKNKTMDIEIYSRKIDIGKEDFKSNDRKRKAPDNVNQTNCDYKKISVKKFQKNPQKNKNTRRNKKKQ